MIGKLIKIGAGFVAVAGGTLGILSGVKGAKKELEKEKAKEEAKAKEE